ncbi:DNA alkylation repair enzyme [Lactobacillus selangorensis]|uniref:DNA alkylation repair enzyme n=1 Tax=Lactobacillus selangorensis TaxID=81857 RepID=A0A0R2FPV1_9LACO|nr:DNA alkylation repair enzyme [Lactobacillus selangorensis]KRN33801.1 DNA alkylation repair enzyme [Lactobacillus selangorensis]
MDQLFATLSDFYQRPEREYQYAAIDLAVRNVRRFEFTDLQRTRPYLGVKQWWDSIDAWAKLYREYLKRHPDDFDRVAALFAGNDDFWLRRISLTLQLGFKERTKTDFLTHVIETDLQTDEFFIQKAIGWALRDYSKTNPQWVAAFIATHSLSKLAVREGSKYL